MKIAHERFFVLTAYNLLLKHLDLVAKEHINCSIYLSAHDVLDDYKRIDIDKIKSFFGRNGLRIMTHGPFLDLNPGSLDEEIRELCSGRFLEALKVSKLLDSKCVTFHSGFRPVPYKKYRDEWLKNSIGVWKRTVELAIKEDIKINIENVFEETPELLIELVEEIDSPNFNLCFDAGHFNAFSDTPPLEAFNMLPPDRIGEIHISDNDGSEDQHLPLGEGNIDLDALFGKIEALRIEPIVTLEPKDVTGAEKDLQYLKKEGILQ